MSLSDTAPKRTPISVLLSAWTHLGPAGPPPLNLGAHPGGRDLLADPRGTRQQRWAARRHALAAAAASSLPARSSCRGRGQEHAQQLIDHQTVRPALERRGASAQMWLQPGACPLAQPLLHSKLCQLMYTKQMAGGSAGAAWHVRCCQDAGWSPENAFSSCSVIENL